MSTRAERLGEFLVRLQRAPPCATYQEARRRIDATLNAVEDELTSIPFNPSCWRTDGRMYPAQDDAIVFMPDHPTITCFRHRAHRTFIGANGSFEIQSVTGEVLISKPGADRRNVWESSKGTTP